MTKLKYVDWIIIVLIMLLLVAIKKGHAADFVPDNPEKIEALVMAIYQAEGGVKTNFPFGIKSVSCSGYAECKRICQNTVVNNIARWEKSKAKGDKRDYITFLWHRFCPPKLNKLNLNWKRNVLYFLKKGKTMQAAIETLKLEYQKLINYRADCITPTDVVLESERFNKITATMQHLRGTIEYLEGRLLSEEARKEKN